MNYFEEKYDAVVMLTWSDWYTEPRSNRYHYASRFAADIRVIFVQPDIYDPNRSAYTQNTENDNITVLHVWYAYSGNCNDYIQGAQLDYMLLRLNIVSPLFWVYNYHFAYYLAKRSEPVVFHATEDYVTWMKQDLSLVKQILNRCDLIISVTELVERNYVSLVKGDINSIVLKNGVDYEQWRLSEDEIYELGNNRKKIAVFQGGINSRIDYSLLDGVIAKMPEWEFWFIGRDSGSSEFSSIRKKYNTVKYYGELSIDELVNCCKKASVGLIPYIPNEEIRNSLPLKTFEYLACGIPVVSVPIDELMGFDNCIYIASTPDDFVDAIEKAYHENSVDRIKRYMSIAKEHDYDKNYNKAKEKIAKLNFPVKRKYRVNVLYDQNSMHVFTIKNYLEMFERWSCNEIIYTPATGGAVCQNGELDYFDAVIVFYSIRVCVKGHLSSSYEEALTLYTGNKILIIQDDYDNTEETRRFIDRVHINTVYTVVPYDQMEKVYPKKRFPDTYFFNVLTGYISEEMHEYQNVKQTKDRKILIGYRGRDIGAWYGDLGHDKLMIGIRMKEECKKRNLNVDIEWEDDKRIYKGEWLEWVASCKAILGTESGSNVFDDNGTLKKLIQNEIQKHPNITYEELHDKYLKDVDGRVITNQISPKVFEAISLKTALVLMEGEYSGVIEPWIHFIPLKKDYSNIEEVLTLVQDDSYLQELVNRAYDDVMDNPEYQYKWLIQHFDKTIEAFYLPRKKQFSRNQRDANLVRRIWRRLYKKLVGRVKYIKHIMIVRTQAS